jgi:hypothetical protein
MYAENAKADRILGSDTPNLLALAPGFSRYSDQERIEITNPGSDE